jgi:hypothetical protein
LNTTTSPTTTSWGRTENHPPGPSHLNPDLHLLAQSGHGHGSGVLAPEPEQPTPQHDAEDDHGVHVVT